MKKVYGGKGSKKGSKVQTPFSQPVMKGKGC